jgi:anti-sigma B factor antagonist
MIEVVADSDDGVTVAHVAGEVDAFNASELRSALEPLTSAPRLVIDLAGVPFVDSAGLGALIGAVRRVRELDGKVALARPRPALAKLLDHTGISRLVAVTANVEQAVAALE